MIELPVADAADQEFSAVLATRRCTMRLRFLPLPGRWFMDFAVDDQPVIRGRKLVVGVDLLEPFDLGLGHLVVLPAKPGADVVVGRAELPNGVARLYHYTDADLP